MKKFLVLVAVVIMAVGCKQSEGHDEEDVKISIGERKADSSTEISEQAVRAPAVYTSCGHITHSGSAINATVRTYLPKIKGAGYRYVKYYNISNGKHFGVLGVLTTTGHNTDLRLRTEPIELQTAGNATIDLKSLKPYKGGLDFKDLSPGQDVYFVCYHDTDFEAHSEEVLTNYQSRLPDIFDLDNPKGNKNKNDEPKVGNGGILSVTGCL